jgi:Rrf2 family protein
MRISRRTDYGVILVNALADTYRARRYRSLAVVSKIHGLPLAFAKKLAERLREAQILDARRGQEGGYRLVKDPRRISLKDMMEILGEKPLMRCMGVADPEKVCPLAKTCPTRHGWLLVDERLKEVFEKVSVANL